MGNDRGGGGGGGGGGGEGGGGGKRLWGEKSCYHCMCTRTGLSLRLYCGLCSEAKH